MGAGAYLFLERPLWAVVFLGSFLAFSFVTSSAHTREREHDVDQGQDRDNGSRRTIYLLSFLGIGLAFAGPFLAPFARIASPHEAVFIIAMVLLWAGILLYRWATLTLGAFFRTQVTLLDGQRLVTRGPYRFLRHPAYTGGILVYAGIGLAIGNWLSAVAMPLSLIFAYNRRIRVEEAALRERFGAEFEANRARTWAIIPFIW
jgi:protein-S-isoprenylcysteine O-methyltransferase